MTEKQFEIICEDYSLVDMPVYVISDDKLKFDIYGSKKDAERLCTLLNENEQLKKDKFICLDCEHSGYVEIGCLCEYNDHWQEHINECEDFKELRE